MICKVLHIVPSLDYVSGILNSVMNYYSRINKDKIQYDFIYFNESNVNYKNEIEKLGGRYYHFDNMFHYSRFKKQINQFCKDHYGEYSIIYLHMPFLSIFFYELKRRLNAKAFVLHAHSTRFGDTKFTNLRNKILYKMFKEKADCYFACSKIAGESLFDDDYQNNGFYLLNICNIDMSKNAPSKEDAKEKLSLENTIVIGHVGIFAHPKNHKFIIDVFGELLKINGNCRLLLVGDGPLRNEIEEYAKSKSVYEKIIFAGPQKDVGKYYAAMDAFIFPSVFEGFAIALVEAQSFGIPCIASDVIVPEANINKDNNCFVSLDLSDKEWAELIINKINNKVDCDYLSNFKNETNYRIKLLEDKLLSLSNIQ